jgi:hypothetical protein
MRKFARPHLHKFGIGDKGAPSAADRIITRQLWLEPEIDEEPRAKLNKPLN